MDLTTGDDEHVQSADQPAEQVNEVLPGQLPARLPSEVSAPDEPDEVLARYARLVRATLGVPVGLVSLVSAEGQVFPGAEGLPTFWQQARCTGLSHSFCQHVVAHDAPLVVRDAREVPGLATNLAIADIGVVAYAGFPIHDPDGVAVGSLCAIDSRPRDWSQHDLDVLADLAATAFAALTAQALERITAHEAEIEAGAQVARFSETLQRSLLTSPPEPDHLHIAVRYSPAAKAAEVGGDWYDAFLTADGTTSLVIGDVTGHDRVAAAAMGQLRNLLRGIGYAVGDPPAAILATLDRAAHDLGVDTTATVVLARVEQTPEQRRVGERLLRWSNAGHPPPLLIAPDATVTYLETTPDLMLGVAPGTTRHDHEVVLESGSTLLLCTDGLVERRGGSLPAGLAWLAATVAELAHLTVDDLCDELLARVREEVEDDVALLALRAYPEDEPRPAPAGPGHDPRDEPTADGADPA